MAATIRVAILDDHQSIVDGYMLRLSGASGIEVVGAAACGEELEALLAESPADVLLMDVSVPVSGDNPSPYPILHAIPRLHERYPDLIILAISMHAQRALIQGVMDAGASGYILKDDGATIRNLGAVIRSVVSGDIHLSQQAYRVLMKRVREPAVDLSARQREALSLCAAHPEDSLAQLARLMDVAPSTLRNLLSQAYVRLDVHTRAAAVARARDLGLITPPAPQPA